MNEFSFVIHEDRFAIYDDGTRLPSKIILGTSTIHRLCEFLPLSKPGIHISTTKTISIHPAPRVIQCKYLCLLGLFVVTQDMKVSSAQSSHHYSTLHPPPATVAIIFYKVPSRMMIEGDDDHHTHNRHQESCPSHPHHNHLAFLSKADATRLWFRKRDGVFSGQGW
ncbi:hypothetical protein AVEN_136973-1 [Araneus ventricosus]|uniref:Uncharacterized protein n=1 Tax=Araneus ventricosus TaxID=182803 RepID=A0A4Y2BIF8_ARAVE|nr:hypothetical protein AVEN_136973-1 [Araneus ventricosus]